jgi:hypothetical protein
LFGQLETISRTCTSGWRGTVRTQKLSVGLGQSLETLFHETEPVYVVRCMIVPLEKLKKGRTFAIIKTPAFFNDEPRNAKTKPIDIRYRRSFRNPPARTIQSFIGGGNRIGSTVELKIARQLLMKTKVESSCFIRIFGTKKVQ